MLSRKQVTTRKESGILTKVPILRLALQEPTNRNWTVKEKEGPILLWEGTIRISSEWITRWEILQTSWKANLDILKGSKLDRYYHISSNFTMWWLGYKRGKIQLFKQPFDANEWIAALITWIVS